MTKTSKINNNFIPLYRRDLLSKAGILYQPSTLRKWKQLGKYKEYDLFRKLNGRLYISLAGWQKLQSANRMKG